MLLEEALSVLVEVVEHQSGRGVGAHRGKRGDGRRARGWIGRPRWLRRWTRWRRARRWSWWKPWARRRRRRRRWRPWRQRRRRWRCWRPWQGCWWRWRRRWRQQRRLVCLLKQHAEPRTMRPGVRRRRRQRCRRRRRWCRSERSRRRNRRVLWSGWCSGWTTKGVESGSTQTKSLRPTELVVRLHGLAVQTDPANGVTSNRTGAVARGDRVDHELLHQVGDCKGWRGEERGLEGGAPNPCDTRDGELGLLLRARVLEA